MTKKLILLFHGNYFSSIELLLLHHDGPVSPPPPRGPSSPPPPDTASAASPRYLVSSSSSRYIFSLSRPYMLHHCSLRERNTTVITIDFALVFIILSLFPLSISSVGIDFPSCLFESVEA
ncbi:hypothetical protein ACSQ67_024870 [Phaseolus vulgaris]